MWGVWHVACSDGIVQGCGAIMAAVEAACGRVAECVGKPSQQLAQLLIDRQVRQCARAHAIPTCVPGVLAPSQHTHFHTDAVGLYIYISLMNPTFTITTNLKLMHFMVVLARTHAHV